MALDAYSPCPCGSGKKFKWCCQPVHARIEQAFAQNDAGQHVAALKTIETVVADQPNNPEAWGRQAQLLHLNGRTEEAETALQKAFQINSNYPFGFLLQALFRQQEGEQVGALLLLRKAADAYDPEARDQLAYVFELIGDLELRRNRPIAARAALARSLHLAPANTELRNIFDSVFGEKSRLPIAVRGEYRFLGVGTTASPEKKAAWSKALLTAETGRLSDAARAFDELTRADPLDAPAWFNLGLTLAWLGDNRKALDALDRYVELEPDEIAAAKAWALAEVLRCGHGMEEVADHLEHRVTFRVRQPQPLIDLLQGWERAGRLSGLQAGQMEGLLSGLVLQETVSLVEVAGPPPAAPLGAYLMIAGNILSLAHPNPETLDKIVAEVKKKLSSNAEEIERSSSPIQLGDVVVEAFAFPARTEWTLDIDLKMKEHAQRYFEEVWPNRPLKSLGGLAPVDAAGNPTYRKKLLGVIAFLEQSMKGSAPRRIEGGIEVESTLYDFNRLRHKFSLEATPTEKGSTTGGPDLSAMNATELAGVDAKELSVGQLEQAFRTAVGLDARELAGKFARELVGRPADPTRPDRYFAWAHLIQLSLDDGNTNEALATLDAATQADAAGNEGKRRNDLDLRRGQLLAKHGDTDAAAAVFEGLVARAPDELKYRGSAAEALMGKARPKALAFAEAGLSAARSQNNRDMEQYFLELVSAAKR